MPAPDVLELLRDGTTRLVRTVDRMTEADWPAPSLLPGWTRAHVVAHLTLNAEGLSAALEGVHEHRRVPMYASQEARDADIEELAKVEPGELRERFLASTTVIRDWLEELADNLEEERIERVPGGRVFQAGDAAVMRVREVEIHHAGLGLDYTPASWPVPFTVLLLDSRAASYEGDVGFTAHATDLDRSWTFGAGGPTVSGAASALAWWSTGRGDGDGLTSDDGTVPRIGAW